MNQNLDVITHNIVNSLAVENACDIETGKISVFSELFVHNPNHKNFKMVTLAQILDVKLTYS